MLSSLSLDLPRRSSSSQDVLSYYFTWSGGNDQTATVIHTTVFLLHVTLFIYPTTLSFQRECDEGHELSSKNLEYQNLTRSLHSIYTNQSFYIINYTLCDVTGITHSDKLIRITITLFHFSIFDFNGFGFRTCNFAVMIHSVMAPVF